MILKHNNESYSVEPETKDGISKVKINGELQHFSINRIDENIFSVQNGNHKFEVYAVADENHVYVSAEGQIFTFDKATEESKSFDSSESESADIAHIKPPMPGTVVKVLVEKGAAVSDGDALVIVEAMKMETSLYSPISGIVTEVNCKAGEQVDTNVSLVVVNKNIEKN
ncbi:MAG: pyruvate carboxylase [Ignavibacteria bacterium]|nr:pyruvate carboxylase [Ignavibacteria bacterium]